MEDLFTYQIIVRGPVTEGDLAAFCPPGLSLERRGTGGTLLTLRSDQAGLIGFIRQLHNLGFVLLSLTAVQLSQVDNRSLCNS